MTRFEFSTVPRIVFGAGAAGDIVPLTRGFGRRALVVHGRSPERAAPVIASLGSGGVETSTFVVATEPDTGTVAAGAALARRMGADMIIGIGGGSVVDAAKAIAALATNDGDVLDYLEVVGQGRALQNVSLPCVAIPTTAGTGSEATRNAVLTSKTHRVKVSLRGPFVLPRLAIVDPALTYALPPAMTASTGLDALTQLTEAYVSCRATPITDALCQEGIVRVRDGLRRAFHDGDHEARAHMSIASLWSGIALANGGLGAVHGFAAPIGGLFDAPHGAVCAALLPHVVAANIRAIETRAPQHPAHSKFRTLARLVTGRSDASARHAVAWLEDLVSELAIPGLRTYGIQPEHVDDVVDKAARASSMKGNPLELTRDELTRVLVDAI